MPLTESYSFEMSDSGTRRVTSEISRIIDSSNNKDFPSTKMFTLSDVRTIIELQEVASERLAERVLSCVENSLQKLVINSPYHTPRSERRSRSDEAVDVDLPSPMSPFSLQEEILDEPRYLRHSDGLDDVRHLNGRDLLRVKKTTISKKSGLQMEWHDMPMMSFGSSDNAVSYFKLQGWRLEKANKFGKKGQRYLNFYCSHGGDSHKHHRKVEKKQSSDAGQINHRSFGDPQSARFCCQARLNATYYPSGELKYSVKAVGHNHCADREIFSLPLAKKDPSMAILDIINREAKDHPALRAGDLFTQFIRAVDNLGGHSAEEKERLKDVIGVLRRDKMREVTELVRRARHEDKRLDLEYLLQMFLKDSELSGDHIPRLIGLSFDYDNTSTLRKLCILISTRTMLRRALFGNNQALLIDGTHQTNSSGRKIITFGTEDRWRKFHLIAIAITTEESIDEISSAIDALRISVVESRYEDDPVSWYPKVVMADGSSAITGGVVKVFPESLRLNCFYHVKAGCRDKWDRRLSSEKYDELQRGLSILANARSPQQFDAWVEHFVSLWREYDEVVHYIRSKCRFGDWQRNFYWGAGGLMSISNCRTNNSTECFNKVFRNIWIKRSICPLARLIDILKGTQMELESRAGCELIEAEQNIPDLLKIGKFASHWKRAHILLRDADSSAREVGCVHWANDYNGMGGKVYYVSSYSVVDNESQKLFDGNYNPFEDVPNGCLTFIPNDDLEIAKTPPIGAMCLCEDYIMSNWCCHILYCLVTTGRLTPPLGSVRIGCTIESHGLRRPKNPHIGARNCLKKLKSRKCSKRKKSMEVIPKLRIAKMMRGTLFLAECEDAVDLFSFCEYRDDDKVLAEVYWYDYITQCWAKWDDHPTRLILKDDICYTHIVLSQGRIPENIVRELKLA